MRPHRGVLIAGTALVLTTSCATVPSKSASSVDYRHRAAQLARELRKKNAVIEELREKNQVLSQRRQRQSSSEKESPASLAMTGDLDSDTSPAWQMPQGAFGKSLEQQEHESEFGPVGHSDPSTKPSVSSSPALSPDRVAKEEPPSIGADLPLYVLPKTLPPKKKSRSGWVREPQAPAAPVTEIVKPKMGTETGEGFLYGKIMQSYKKHEYEQFSSAVRLFLKTYPDSVYADNALYLEALAALETKQNRRAQASLEQLLRTYPFSNKAVSALFASAVLAREDKDYGRARAYLNQLIHDYPGSVEAGRAQLEQRWISKLETTGRRQ